MVRRIQRHPAFMVLKGELFIFYHIRRQIQTKGDRVQGHRIVHNQFGVLANNNHHGTIALIVIQVVGKNDRAFRRGCPPRQHRGVKIQSLAYIIVVSNVKRLGYKGLVVHLRLKRVRSWTQMNSGAKAFNRQGVTEQVVVVLKAQTKNNVIVIDTIQIDQVGFEADLGKRQAGCIA